MQHVLTITLQKSEQTSIAQWKILHLLHTLPNAHSNIHRLATFKFLLDYGRKTCCDRANASCSCSVHTGCTRSWAKCENVAFLSSSSRTEIGRRASFTAAAKYRSCALALRSSFLLGLKPRRPLTAQRRNSLRNYGVSVDQIFNSATYQEFQMLEPLCYSYN